DDPFEDGVGELPGPAPLGELATTVDNQKIERADNAIRSDQEGRFLAERLRHSDDNGIDGLEQREQKGPSAQLSLDLFSGGQLAAGRRTIAQAPGPSSNTVRGDAV